MRADFSESAINMRFRCMIAKKGQVAINWLLPAEYIYDRLMPARTRLGIECYGAKTAIFRDICYIQ